MIAIIAALPREIAALVKGTRPDAALLGRGIHLHRVKNALVVAAGMGSLRATLAVEAAFAAGEVTELVSVGLAGGCAAGVVAGSVYEVDVVVDTRTGERFRAADSTEDVVLATIDNIASVEEKQRLHRAYGAVVVDMEAATVGRLAVAHGVGFRAIKAVSDEHDFELASLGRFAGKHGHFRTGAFALHTALRPHRWPAAVKLGRGSSRGLSALELHLRAVLQGA